MATEELKIVNHRLSGATWKASPNCRGKIVPQIVVIHYTGDNSLKGAVSWLCAEESGVSAHVVNGRTGELYQLVPFNIRAWHAGRSEWNDEPDVNSFSIGIENVGTGKDWPQAQIDRLVQVIEAIVKTYKIEAIVGHEDICIPEGRKTDPGPHFPWNIMKAKFPNLVDRG